MAKVKFDVSDVDPNESADYEQPQPGIYECQIIEANPGFSKGSDGKPDRSRPRIEVVFKVIEEGKYRNAQLWYYLTLGKSDSDFPKKKLDQFLQVFGIAGDDVRKGEFDTDDLVNQKCRVRVRAGKNLDDQYKAEVASVFRLEAEEDLSGEEPLEEPGDDEVTFGDEEGQPEEGEDWSESLWTQDEAAQASLEDLKESIKSYDVTPPRSKSACVDKLGELQAEFCEAEGIDNPWEGTEESGDEDDGIVEDDDDGIIEDEGNDSELLSEDDLKAMDNPTLAKTARDFDIEPKGMKKSEVIAAIIEAQGSSPESDDEDPF